MRLGPGRFSPVSGWSRITCSPVLDFLPALLVDLALYLVSFTLQHVLADRLGTKTSVELPLALFSGVYTIAYVAGTLGLGSVADRPGWRRASMSVGLLVTALVPLCMVAGGLELDLWVFYVAMTLLGGGSALFWPAQQARIGDRSGPERLPGALMRFNVGWTAGKALGLLFAGVLYQGESGPPHPTYALLAAMAAALAALGLQVFDRAPEVPKGAEASVSHQRRKRDFLVAALAVNFALWGLGNSVIAFIPKLGDELSISVRDQGALVSGLVFAQSAVFLLLGARSSWTYKALLVVAVPFLGALAGLALAAAPSARWAVPAALTAGALGGGAYAFSIFYSLDYDERRGLRMSINEAVLGLGALLPLPGGALARATGTARAPYIFVAGVCFLAGVVAAVALRPRAVTPRPDGPERPQGA